jgi:3'-5' exoribonuclease
MNLFDQYQIKNISDFQTGDKIQNYFKILSIQKKTKKNGDPYLAMEVLDKSGKIGAKIWENLDSLLPVIQAGNIYRLNGLITEFQNRKEIKVESLKPVSGNETDIIQEEFEEKAPFNVADRFDDLMDTLRAHIRNPFFMQLVDRFAVTYRQEFEKHYGAQKIHHAYTGGLLEHTHAVMKLAVLVGEFYQLDTELMLIGALFHDIGKLVEYTRVPSVETTREGGLIGHIILGNQMFMEMKNQIKEFPENLSIKIQHLIISHHGEREFGAPEVPKTPEAFALHIIDLLDSKLKVFKETIDKTDKGNSFSEYNRILNRRIYIPEESNDE